MIAISYLDIVEDFSDLSDEELRALIEEDKKKNAELKDWPPIE